MRSKVETAEVFWAISQVPNKQQTKTVKEYRTRKHLERNLENHIHFIRKLLLVPVTLLFCVKGWQGQSGYSSVRMST
jgi:hypothetical protein